MRPRVRCGFCRQGLLLTLDPTTHWLGDLGMPLISLRPSLLICVYKTGRSLPERWGSSGRQRVNGVYVSRESCRPSHCCCHCFGDSIVLGVCKDNVCVTGPHPTPQRLACLRSGFPGPRGPSALCAFSSFSDSISGTPWSLHMRAGHSLNKSVHLSPSWRSECCSLQGADVQCGRATAVTLQMLLGPWLQAVRWCDLRGALSTWSTGSSWLPGLCSPSQALPLFLQGPGWDVTARLQPGV